MSRITLFAAAEAVREALSRIDEATGEIDESYAESRSLFESKAVACVAYLIEEKAAIRATEDALYEISQQLASRKARHERFHGYVRDCMAATGTRSIEHEAGLFRAVLREGRDVAVEIEPGAAFPAALCAEPKPPQPSKQKIRAAIEAGEPVAGARLVRRDRLTIR